MSEPLHPLERLAAQAMLSAGMDPCAEGHSWISLGGKNCGCEWIDEDGVYPGYCSVPVHVCDVCGDCDYGENEEATKQRRECAERRCEEELADV